MQNDAECLNVDTSYFLSQPWHWPYRGICIGEASHPGPELVINSDIDVDDEFHDILDEMFNGMPLCLDLSLLSFPDQNLLRKNFYLPSDDTVPPSGDSLLPCSIHEVPDGISFTAFGYLLSRSGT